MSECVTHCVTLRVRLQCGTAAANDLKPDDSGLVGRGIKRSSAAKPAVGGKRKRASKKKGVLANACGDEWEADDEFEVEQIVGTRLSAGPAIDNHPKGVKLFYVIWKDFAAEAATWEPAENIGTSKELLSEYLYLICVAG